MNCILPQNLTTPEKLLGNPWHQKSFFEPDQYKSVLERIAHGHTACETNIEIYRNLVEIFENFSKSISQWSQKSQRQIHQTTEFGSSKKASLEMVRAMELVAKEPEELGKKLKDNVVQKMIEYDRENYGKSLIHLKKCKEFQKEFQKVQKPWVERLQKFTETKQNYEKLEKSFKSAKRAEKLIQENDGITDKEKRDAKRSLEKHGKDVEVAEKKFEAAREDLHNAKLGYEQSMTEILERSFDVDRKRLKHLNESFRNIRSIFVVEDNPKCKELDNALKAAIGQQNIDQDIQTWNENYGSASKLPWPSVENSEQTDKIRS